MKRMTKILALVLAVAITATCLVGVLAGCVTADEKLIVYNWEDYIDRDLIDEFEEYYKEQTGKSIKVTYSTFDTNETMLTEVEKGDSVIDLICPSEYAIQRLIDKGYLQKINKSAMSNTGNLDPIFEEKLSEIFDAEYDIYSYMVPYFWGTLGILYNTAYVTEEQVEEAGWGILWNSTKIDAVNGKILMKDSVRDVYVAAVMYLKEQNKLPSGYEDKSAQELINDTSDAMIAAVGDVLAAQKAANVLKGYEVDLGKDDMVAGTACVNLAWSGDALFAIDEAPDGVELAYYAPEIGGNLWFDGWVMPKTAQNERAALMFMDYMCRPESGMRNMLEVGYTSALNREILANDETAVQALIDGLYDGVQTKEEFLDEFFTDVARYPILGDVSELGVMKDFGAKEADLIAMWEKVKASQSNGILPIILIAIGVVLLVAVVAAVAVAVVKKKKSRRRIRRPYGSVSATKASVEEEEDDEEDDDEEEEVNILENFDEVDDAVPVLEDEEEEEDDGEDE